MDDSNSNSIVIGRFKLCPPYCGDPAYVAIHRTDDAVGEGGDFPLSALESVLAVFYEDHF